MNEFKNPGGKVLLTKEADRNGIRIGIVEGYIATWDLDKGDWLGTKDRFVKGAFSESISDHAQKNRQIRLKDHHDRIIGGFPIENVREDDRGLFGVGEINLEVQQGKEAFALAKQGVLSDFSIGFRAEESSHDPDRNIRTITKAEISEGSIVGEPMNPNANITQVKAAVPYQDFPLAERDFEWEASEAVSRARTETGSEDSPSSSYKNYFIWYNRDSPDDFESYRLPIADVVQGQAKAVPGAIFSAAALMMGDNNNIPELDRDSVIAHINQYYVKMGLDNPFDEKMVFCGEIIEKNWDRKAVESAFQGGHKFSKEASKSLVEFIIKGAGWNEPLPDDEGGNNNWLLLAQELRKGVVQLKETSCKSSSIIV